MLPLKTALPLNPNSILSMVTHGVKFPNPGSEFISMEELMESIRDMFKEMQRNIDSTIGSLARY